MFEEQLSHQIMPKSFDRTNDNKTDPRSQRKMLDAHVKNYESEIQHYERLSQQEMAMLELDSSVETVLIDFIKACLNRRTETMKRDISYQVSFFRSGMSRRYHRHFHSASETTKTTHVVFPQVIVDAPNVPLNGAELAYLSRGKTCFLSRKKTYLLLFRSNLYQTKSEFASSLSPTARSDSTGP